MLAVAVVLPLPTAAASAAVSRYTVLDNAGARFYATSAASWGGTFTASTGERVTIRFSDSYPQDPALAQRWADFLASLLHGPELQTVTVFLTPYREVRTICGAGALACYSPGERLLVAPGEQVLADVTAESVVMHEYGHHVAESRSDAPWQAVDYGTKRWASYIQVCARTKTGELHPGSEDAATYQLNPGEGFAETYRVLNEHRLGITESPWDVVSRTFYPDVTALAAVEQDVTKPWIRNSTSTSSPVLSTRTKVRTVSVATPLDGVMQLTLRGARRSTVALDLLNASGASVAHTVVTGLASRSVNTTVCGTRSYRVRLTLQRGGGQVRLAVSKP